MARRARGEHDALARGGGRGVRIAAADVGELRVGARRHHDDLARPARTPERGDGVGRIIELRRDSAQQRLGALAQPDQAHGAAVTQGLRGRGRCGCGQRRRRGDGRTGGGRFDSAHQQERAEQLGDQ